MTETTTSLTCPKCNAPMRVYERNGVTIDQCTDCRGVYLDRGELDRLIDAESGYYQSSRPESRPEPARSQPSSSPRPNDHYEGRSDGKYRRKKGGFLSELFD